MNLPINEEHLDTVAFNLLTEAAVFAGEHPGEWFGGYMQGVRDLCERLRAKEPVQPRSVLEQALLEIGSGLRQLEEQDAYFEGLKGS